MIGPLVPPTLRLTAATLRDRNRGRGRGGPWEGLAVAEGDRPAAIAEHRLALFPAVGPGGALFGEGGRRAAAGEISIFDPPPHHSLPWPQLFVAWTGGVRSACPRRGRIAEFPMGASPRPPPGCGAAGAAASLYLPSRQLGGRFFPAREGLDGAAGKTLVMTLPPSLHCTAATLLDRGSGWGGQVADRRGGTVEHRRASLRLRGRRARAIRYSPSSTARVAFLPAREGAGGPGGRS